MRHVAIPLVLMAFLPCMVTAEEAPSYTEDEIKELAADFDLDPQVFFVEGDPEYGEYLAGECTICHQASGDYDGIPGIVRWDAVDFTLAMQEYKTKQREHPAMQMIAGRLGDEEIASLAAYFEQLQEEE